MKLGSLELESIDLERRVSEFDLTLMVAESGGSLALSLEYCVDLFDESSAARMLQHYENLLAAIASNPGQRVSDLNLLSPREQHQILSEWNDTTHDYDRGLLAHEQFERQAARKPEAIGLQYGEYQISYGELNRRANKVARRLLAGGAVVESRVGICIRRGVEMVEAMLGVLKAGCGYVPLDPNLPTERLRYMVEDSGLKALLATAASAEACVSQSVKVICLDLICALLLMRRTSLM
jgi:non-ribosomal peptide synthetase component F